MKAIGAKNRFILSLFLSEALLIGLIGSTLGILMGSTGAYMLTSGFGASTPGAASPHITPIFLPYDLLNVWFLSPFLIALILSESGLLAEDKSKTVSREMYQL